MELSPLWTIVVRPRPRISGNCCSSWMLIGPCSFSRSTAVAGLIYAWILLLWNGNLVRCSPAPVVQEENGGR